MSFTRLFVLVAALLLLEPATTIDLFELPTITLDGAKSIGGCWLCLVDPLSTAVLLSSSMADKADISTPDEKSIAQEYIGYIGTKESKHCLQLS